MCTGNYKYISRTSRTPTRLNGRSSGVPGCCRLVGYLEGAQDHPADALDMPVLSKWKKSLGNLVRRNYSTPQIIAFISPAPLFLIAGVVLSFYLPGFSFVITLFYFFIILPALIMASQPSSSWRAPKAALHSFLLCWAIAGLLPIDDYLARLLG